MNISNVLSGFGQKIWYDLQFGLHFGKITDLKKGVGRYLRFRERSTLSVHLGWVGIL